MPEVKYDRHYRESPAACGEPFAEFAAFVTSTVRPGMSVLDLGCGQGRDTLLFARAGCRVVGVDHSAVGIGQLRAAAEAEGPDVTAHVVDLTAWRPAETFDVVLLDRVLHMLPSDGHRTALLQVAVEAVRPGGYVLVADGPRHRALIRGAFSGWTFVKDTKNRTFARRP